MYVASGRLLVDGSAVETSHFGLLGGEGALKVSCERDTRAMLLGGDPLPEPTVIFWNFIADTIEEARASEEKWKSGGFERLQR